MNSQEIDQLALIHWQDDLAKFFPVRKEPNYTEYNMFAAGFRAGENSLSRVNELEAENDQLRAALEQIRDRGPAFPGDKKHEIASSALEDYESR